MTRINDIDMDMILDFFASESKFNVATEEAEFQIYNERCLQFELGKFLKDKFGEDYKVEYERNVERPPVNYGDQVNSVKEDIDIFIYSDKYPENPEGFAIELKYPRNKAEAKRLYDFAEDIKFMEDVKKRLVVKTYCLTIASDSVFYKKRSPVNTINQKVYGFFRTKDKKSPDDKGVSLPNMTSEPQALKITDRDEILLNHAYDIVWNRAHDGNMHKIYQRDGYEKTKDNSVYFYFVKI